MTGKWGCPQAVEDPGKIHRGQGDKRVLSLLHGLQNYFKTNGELSLEPPKHTLALSPASLLRDGHSFVCLAQRCIQQRLGRG